METWQIILSLVIVSLSILLPIYYSYQKKRNQTSEAIERMQIREYGRQINEETRRRNK